jgi:lipopolysaccharide transport system ATP-binding protein
MSEVLVKVEGVSKKFCRSLKRSLWYGVQDICADLNPFKRDEVPVKTHSLSDRRIAHALNTNGATESPTSKFNIPISDHSQNGLRRDEFWAVNDVSFEVKRGECLGLIGHNGAGKTTLLKMLNGLIKPDHGRIEIRGRVGALIALGAGFNPILTGRENIYVNGAVLGLTKREIEAKLEEIIDFADIREFIDSPVQSYSSGMQVRLGFSIATALKPDILLLDEVLAVGDAAFRVKCFNRMHQILNSAAVVFVSHNMPQLTRISNRMLLLQSGRVVTEDHNLGKVISQYHSLNASRATMAITGSGKTEIHEVRLEDSAGSELTRLKHGHPFRIVVSFTAHEPSPPASSQLLLVFNDEEQNNVAQILQPVEPHLSAKGYKAILTFSSTPFDAGRYYIALAFLSGNRGELGSVVHNAASFLVENTITGYAPMWIQPTNFVIAEAHRCSTIRADMET